MQKLFDKLKENASKKLLVTLAMFVIAPWLTKLRSAGWDVTDDMVEKIIEGTFASGSIYVLVQGVKDWIKTHHEGVAAVALAKNAAFPPDAHEG